MRATKHDCSISPVAAPDQKTLPHLQEREFLDRVWVVDVGHDGQVLAV
jgi:hypothetical protein